MQQHFPPVDENVKEMARLRETTVKLAKKSAACDTGFNARLGEAAQKQFTMT
jgi:hypothetical protein